MVFQLDLSEPTLRKSEEAFARRLQAGSRPMPLPVDRFPIHVHHPCFSPRFECRTSGQAPNRGEPAPHVRIDSAEVEFPTAENGIDRDGPSNDSSLLQGRCRNISRLVRRFIPPNCGSFSSRLCIPQIAVGALPACAPFGFALQRLLLCGGPHGWARTRIHGIDVHPGARIMRDPWRESPRFRHIGTSSVGRCHVSRVFARRPMPANEQKGAVVDANSGETSARPATCWSSMSTQRAAPDRLATRRGNERAQGGPGSSTASARNVNGKARNPCFHERNRLLSCSQGKASRGLTVSRPRLVSVLDRARSTDRASIETDDECPRSPGVTVDRGHHWNSRRKL
jgi:hypothetical protein